MKVGREIEGLMSRTGKTGVELAAELFTSTSNISAMKHNNRSMQRDMAEHSLQENDDPIYNLDITHRFSQGYSAPYLDGHAVDRGNHLAAMISALKEMTDVQNILILEEFLQHPERATEMERGRAKKAMKEAKEAADELYNLFAVLAIAYKVSTKEVNHEILVKYKATERMK